MMAGSAAPLQYDVVVIGALNDCDMHMAEALAGAGLNCVVVRPKRVGLPNLARLPGKLRHFSPDRILTFANSLEFYRICRRSKCVVTYSGAVSSYLKYLWLLLPVLPFPPIVNVPTGSDITELSVERSLHGFIYRQVLRRAAFTAVPAYLQAIRAIREIRPQRFAFFKYPYLIQDRLNLAGPAESRIVYLHASHLDWAATDNKPGRNSTKGNDRFLRAFIAAAKQGAPIRCRILNRGSDRLLARQLIERAGAAKYFEWLEPVPSADLCRLFAEADVVVDQFDVGGLGATAMEAMAQGRPVMIYLDPDCVPLVYDEPPPVLNCRTEAEIEHTILAHTDRKALRALGDQADQWVRRHHGPGHDMSEFLLRLCMTAGIEWPITQRS